jgi:Skp family chaperone for outer membrane proteins
MKKMLLLTFSVAILSSAFAQNSRNQSRDIVLGQANSGVYSNRNNDRNYGNNDYSYTTRERDAEIARINREFDARINAVRRDRRIRNGEKNHQVSMLENQRRAEIMQLNQRFTPQRSNRYDDRNRRSY